MTAAPRIPLPVLSEAELDKRLDRLADAWLRGGYCDDGLLERELPRWAEYARKAEPVPSPARLRVLQRLERVRLAVIYSAPLEDVVDGLVTVADMLEGLAP